MLLFNAPKIFNKINYNHISIHLMLLFNRNQIIHCNLCCYFNTSNVTIQLYTSYSLHYKYDYFNTSNVTIQLCLQVIIIILILYFNTSNVTIQQITVSWPGRLFFISIHLMLLFNFLICTIIMIKLNISIHLMLLFNKCTH